MSDHIPLEIQSEIIKRLPVKFVIQCRSVSKSLKSLIDSPEFITSHTQQYHHLFVKYWLPDSDEYKYVSIVDDDTFPNQKSPLTIPLPLITTLQYVNTLHSVNGLLCFHCPHPTILGKTIAVLWNPSIQKSVGINIFNSLRPKTGGLIHIGFGVCPNTSDPKLVKINTISYRMVNNREVEVYTCNNWEVEVFMLSTRVWKSVSNIPPAFKICGLTNSHVCIDGFIYWLAYDSFKFADKITSNSIISFDLKSDGFGEVRLPDRLVHTNRYRLEVSKVYESLGLFEYYGEGKTNFCDVWIMKEGVSKSFTKMFSIKAPDSWVRYRVFELTKNGEAIIQNMDDTNSFVLEVYDTSSGSISGMGINGASYSFSVNSYVETLLLLDESDSIIH